MPRMARPASKECEPVKKSLAAFTLLVSLALFAYLGSLARGEQSSARAGGATSVGVVDLSRVLDEYQQFQALREQMRSRVQAKETQLQRMMSEAKQLRDIQKDLDPNSDDYRNNESKLTQLVAQVETFRQQTRRDLINEEATLYHNVYQRVRQAVEWVAQQRGVQLVLRVSNDPISPDNPEEVIKAVNRRVIYHDGALDLTSDVLRVINRSVQQKQAAGQGSPRRLRK